jgi:sec-independent protein translocase protein TatB
LFGFSFSELIVLVVVGLVVIGPKDLPKVLRKGGQWAGKLRRMAGELRAQSGIDEVLRSEGLTESIGEIRKLARGEIESVARDITNFEPAKSDPYTQNSGDVMIAEEREYPRDGADNYECLPDTSLVYDGTLADGPLAKDALYMMGDPLLEIPARVLPDGHEPHSPLADGAENGAPAPDPLADTPAQDATAPLSTAPEATGPSALADAPLAEPRPAEAKAPETTEAS